MHSPFIITTTKSQKKCRITELQVKSDMRIVNSAKKLNELDENIYVKPDKTKKEAEEFKRIGKRKADLLLQHPTTDPENPIVTLKKGVLRVNGVEVDRYNPVQSLF